MLLPALFAGFALGALPPRLAADVDDAYAPKVNPAGLGFLEGAELRLSLARDLSREASDLGLFGAVNFGRAFSLGAMLEVDDVAGDAITRPGLALAVGSPGTVALGVGWSGGPADTFSLGLGLRLSRHLALSVSSLDLAANAGPRPYDFGLAIRLFDDRVLLSSRWRLLQGRAVAHDDGRPDLHALLSIEPLAGVVVAAETDLHFRPSFSVSIAFEHLSIGGFLRSSAVDRPDLGGAEVVLSTRDLPTVFRSAKVAVVELAGDLSGPARFNLLKGGFELPVYGELPLQLEELAVSKEIAGALIKIGSLEIGWAKAEELRAGILRLVAAQKRADCVLSAATDKELFVASACSKVATIPALPVNLDGIAANLIFFAGGLELIGVRPQVVARGRYKSAPEAFTRSGMSEPHREALEAVLSDTQAVILDGIAEGRRLNREVVLSILEVGTLTATEAKARGLVDEVLYPDQLEAWLKASYQRPLSFVDLEDIPRPSRQPWGRAPRIAVVSIDAVITGGRSTVLPLGLGVQAGAQTLTQLLEDLRTDSKVVAVVLRVDSPGGDAVASDLIAEAVRKLAQEKPVVASFGDVAASGGYYVAAAARAIFAERASVTGSIGIFNLGFSVEPLLAKLGITAESIELGEGSNRGTLLRDWTEEERAMTEREVQALYAQFLRVVGAGRRIEPERLLTLAEGRTFSGRAALASGLVDEVGGLVDAVRRARQEAGLDVEAPLDVVIVPRNGGGMPEVVRRLIGEAPPELAGLVPHSLRGLARAVLTLGMGQGARGMAMLPFALNVD